MFVFYQKVLYPSDGSEIIIYPLGKFILQLFFDISIAHFSTDTTMFIDRYSPFDVFFESYNYAIVDITLVFIDVFLLSN